MKNKKQPKEVFYKNETLKNFSIFADKHLCWGLFLIKLQVFRSATLLKRHSNTGAFMNIAKFLKTPMLKKICERLLLNNVEPNFSSIY